MISASLFHINLVERHEWGGDFAQYIQQAINITEGKAASESNYLFNPEFPSLGPASYPNGFPLLLSSIYQWKGNSINGFLCLISFSYVLYGLICFFLFKQRTSYWAALSMFGLIMLNPSLLEFKGYVLSDLPFSVFFLASYISLSFYHKKRWLGLLILSGLLLSYAVFTRTVGGVFVLGSLAFLLIHHRNWRIFIIYLSSFSLPFFLLNWLYPSTASNSYQLIFDQGNWFTQIAKNSESYAYMLRDFFGIFHPNSGFLSVLLGSLVFIFSAIGFWNRATQKWTLTEYLFIPYLLLLLVYPANIYVRFFWPVLPIVMIYALDGLRLILPLIRFSKPLAYLLILAILGLYTPHALRLINAKGPIDSPQSDDAMALFQFVNENVETEDVVSFVKPRVMGLYTKRKSFCTSPDVPLQEAIIKWRSNKVNWLVTHIDRVHQPAKEFIQTYPERVNLEYENQTFIVYRILAY